MTEPTDRLTDQALINDPDRPAVVAQRRTSLGGEITVISTHGAVIGLSRDEAARLASFITGKPYIQRHAVSPAKAKFATVDD